MDFPKAKKLALSSPHLRHIHRTISVQNKHKTNSRFMISNFRLVLNLVCILLGICPASDCGLPKFRNPLSVPSSRAGCKVWSIIHTLHPALEDGTDRGFRNVGKPQSDAVEIPKRIHTIFKTWRKFDHLEIFPVIRIFDSFYFMKDACLWHVTPCCVRWMPLCWKMCCLHRQVEGGDGMFLCIQLYDVTYWEKAGFLRIIWTSNLT